MPRIRKEVFSRPPWERMVRLHERIKSGHFPNSAVLAREFEVSTRTIKRDVEFLKMRFHLPIEYDSRRYGYYYSKPVEHFPGVAVTEAEAFALLVAHRAIGQYRGTPFQKPLQTAFQKLAGHLDNSSRFTFGNLDEALSFRPLAPEDTDLRTFKTLARAVQQQLALRFEYKKLGARKPEWRRVLPYHLACVENVWYLFAHDLERKAMRTFVLTRLGQAKLTGQKFVRRRDFKLDEYLKGSFSVFRGPDDYEVAVEFDAWATDLIRGRIWHASQHFIELPDGCSRLTLRLNNIEEMERWVLSWGAHATVVRPRALAKRIQKTAEALIRRYEQG